MARGGSELLAQLKRRRAELGLKKRLRVMGSSCLGACESGITALVVGADGPAFYGRLDPSSADALIDECVLLGAPGPELRRHRLPPENLLDLSALEGGADADSQEGQST
jgi:(2Fe-2S) ferredoxin